VDLTTGARLRARDILRPTALATSAAIRRLLGRVGKFAPGGAFCPGGSLGLPTPISPSGVDSDDNEARYMDLMPTRTGIEFNVQPYKIGYAMACDESFVTVPYAKISDLMAPGIPASVQGSTGSAGPPNSPAPSPS
jgi:hypothetical protein